MIQAGGYPRRKILTPSDTADVPPTACCIPRGCFAVPQLGFQPRLRHRNETTTLSANFAYPLFFLWYCSRITEKGILLESVSPVSSTARLSLLDDALMRINKTL